MRKFRITPRFRRIVTGDSRNRRCSSNCSRKLWPNASQFDWCVETSYQSMEPSLRQTLPRRAVEAAQVNRTVREYLAELEMQNPVEEPTHSQDKVSSTDPDSTYATKGGTPARMGYYDNYLVDNHSCIVVGVQATGARLSEESRAAEDMIVRFAQWQGRKPESIAADASYGNGEFLQWLMDREITPYMPTRDAVGRTRSPFYGPECFTYLPDSNSYICPAGQQLNYGGRNEGYVRLYRNAQQVRSVPTENPVYG